MASVRTIHRKHDGGFAGVKFRIFKEKDKDIVVGIFKEVERYPLNYPESGGGPGKSVAEVAAMHHPRWPFITKTFLKHQIPYKRALAAIVKLILKGTPGGTGRGTPVDVPKGRRNLGNRGKKDMEQMIRDIKQPPNSKIHEMRKGFNDPLVWTHHLNRDGIDYRVED